MTIGNQIAFYRKRMNLTQDQLAQQLEVTNQAVSKWETDACCPDIAFLPRLADLFGVTIDALFDRPAGEAGMALPWPDDGKLQVALFRGHSLAACAPACPGYSFENDDVTVTIGPGKHK